MKDSDFDFDDYIGMSNKEIFRFVEIIDSNDVGFLEKLNNIADEIGFTEQENIILTKSTFDSNSKLANKLLCRKIGIFIYYVLSLIKLESRERLQIMDVLRSKMLNKFVF